MPRKRDLPPKATKLLTLLCALPEEVRRNLLRRLPVDRAGDEPSTDQSGPTNTAEVLQVASARVVQSLVLRVEALEKELHSLRDRILDSGPRLLTKKAFLREYPDLYSRSGLDKVLFLKEDNGLSQFDAIHQRAKGCRVLIDPKKFLEWYRWFHAHG